MVDRINILLKAKNITARQFAEEIGIQPSGMSHILSGRNNPSLDFVMKVMKRWPEVNINWLMFGKGEMYVNPPINSSSAPVEELQEVSDNISGTVDYDLFSQPSVTENSEATSQSVNFSGTEEKAQPEVADPDVEPAIESPEDSVPVSSQPPSLNDFPQSRFAPPAPQPRENCVNGTNTPSGQEKTILAKKSIEKIVVFYSDHTFGEYYPE